MRDAIIITSLLGSLFIYGLTSGLLETTIMFLLFGIIPWQSEPVASTTMLSLWISIASLFIALWLVGAFGKFRRTQR